MKHLLTNHTAYYHTTTLRQLDINQNESKHPSLLEYGDDAVFHISVKENVTSVYSMLTFNKGVIISDEIPKTLVNEYLNSDKENETENSRRDKSSLFRLG